ncbi:hypothetical protein CPS_1190 [Colwellia psychrerythraea 34H]|uniref:Uncharacterized protein n=1 Tax=Colwellia psychrerythraea (strain 34H / ATCC BAA-681) TaxID=167879 RepID=Q486T2_COLP3|nr:hypothetical protein CPS_1190 [Colwellia psychrerythraea 34H]
MIFNLCANAHFKAQKKGKLLQLAFLFIDSNLLRKSYPFYF